MAESVWGDTAAPHPASKQKYTLTATVGGSPSGTFKLNIVAGGVTKQTAAIAYTATGAAIVAAIVAATSAGYVTATGGPIHTTPVALTFPRGTPTVTVDSTALVSVTIAVAKTGAGFQSIPNGTFGGAGKQQLQRPAYSRDYRTTGTPSETYVNPDGSSPAAPRGGVTAVKPGN